MALRVLFVCTGNVCRSPAAQLIFARFAAGNEIACASAGTSGLTGRGVDEPTAYVLKELGVDPTGHVAQRITPGLIEAADLILTATEEHRASVVRERPMAFRKTFTIREFARLGAELPPFAQRPDAAELIARIGTVAGRRGQVDAPLPGGDDIGDPFGAGLEVARTCVHGIRADLGGVIQALGLSVPSVQPTVSS